MKNVFRIAVFAMMIGCVMFAACAVDQSAPAVGSAEEALLSKAKSATLEHRLPHAQNSAAYPQFDDEQLDAALAAFTGETNVEGCTPTTDGGAICCYRTPYYVCCCSRTCHCNPTGDPYPPNTPPQDPIAAPDQSK